MTPNAEACQQLWASLMATCYAMSWNPVAFAACAAAASAAYATCMAAS